MEQLAKLISAISSLVWPAIFIVLIFKFSEPIKKLIDSARGRKFTIKVAGNELTMEEASEQTRVMLSDLQTKIAELEKHIVKKIDNSEQVLKPPLIKSDNYVYPPSVTASSPAQLPETGIAEPSADYNSRPMFSLKEMTTRRILWVDNNPKNNSFVIASLETRGDKIDVALTTQEGLEKFKAYHYDLVITDMARPDSEKAGILLTKQLKAIKPSIPVYIFCSYWTAKYMRNEALSEGVDEITSSATSLMGFVS
jgi:CheY-like chemotaxis protein